MICNIILAVSLTQVFALSYPLQNTRMSELFTDNLKPSKYPKEWLPALPFTRNLTLAKPPLEGNDVVILQNLLLRHPTIHNLKRTGIFDENTQKALAIFQRDQQCSQQEGNLDVETGKLVIQQLMDDGYRDDGVVPDDCKFKLHVPVSRDRTKETTATLYKCGDGGKVLHRFTIRTRGGTDGFQPLNQLTSNGDTPTGLATLDLNSREPVSLVKSFGPYPVLRVVKGLKGNAALGKDALTKSGERDTFLSNYRFGILMHTGIWDDWDPNKVMPNSLGCMHVHPEDQKKVVDLLIRETGAIVHENPFSKRPYPYETQGYISIEEVD